MSQRLGAAARAARLEAGLTMLDVAERAGVSQSAIHRFETQGGWPHQLDRIVDAYEVECGLPEGTIWRRAVGP